MNQLLTTNQVSHIIGFDVRTVRTWCDRGDVFPTARKVPNSTRGQWRILSDDVALLSMVDGQDENASMLADTNQKIAVLEAKNEKMSTELSWYQTEYNKLANTYNTLLNEATELDQVIADQQTKMADQQALITDLQRYKDHYAQQQQKRRSQATNRRAA